jgi:uncharacterized protein YsxB (DUF464 family)
MKYLEKLNNSYMNTSVDNLNKYITLYLNDLEDYSNTNNLMLAESTLNSLKQLIVESKSDISIILKEALVNSSPEKKEVIEDFMLYIKEA